MATHYVNGYKYWEQTCAIMMGWIVIIFRNVYNKKWCLRKWEVISSPARSMALLWRISQVQQNQTVNQAVVNGAICDVKSRNHRRNMLILFILSVSMKWLGSYGIYSSRYKGYEGWKRKWFLVLLGYCSK